MSEGAGHSSGSASDTVIKIVVGLAVLGVIAAIAIPNILTVRGGHGNETAAIATLWNLASCQAQFQSQKHVDLDADGIGEFGTLGEMTGVDGVRICADAARRGDKVAPPVLSPSLGGIGETGIVTKSGYGVRLFLPGVGGGAVRERKAGQWDPGAPFTGPVATDLAEKSWCAYAWPVAYGNSGNRAYFVDEAGRIWHTANKDGRYSGTGAGGPAWDAAMPATVPGPSWASPPADVTEYRGRDGNLWKRLR